MSNNPFLIGEEVLAVVTSMDSLWIYCTVGKTKAKVSRRAKTTIFGCDAGDPVPGEQMILAVSDAWNQDDLILSTFSLSHGKIEIDDWSEPEDEEETEFGLSSDCIMSPTGSSLSIYSFS